MLKVGDKVKILKDKVNITKFDSDNFIEFMSNYKDELCIISEISTVIEDFKYKIKYKGEYLYFKEDELELFKIEKNNELNIEKNDIIEISLINNDDHKLFLKDVYEKIKKYQNDNLKVNVTYNTNVVINKLIFTAFIEARH